jgi:hypothetical protein
MVSRKVSSPEICEIKDDETKIKRVARNYRMKNHEKIPICKDCLDLKAKAILQIETLA